MRRRGMFGDNLKKYRTEKGYSQSDIAEKLFVTRQCVSKWENGTTQPDLQALEKLSDLLGVSIDELVKDGGEKEKKAKNGNAAMFLANILSAAFFALSFLALWRYLPKTVPMHWSAFGDIDRYGSKNEILIMIAATVAILGVDVAMFFSFKRYSNYKKTIYATHGIILFLQLAFAVFVWVMYAEYLTKMFSTITCVTAAMLIIASVVMHPKINKQNMIMGVRVKETLNSEAVWKKTNALACYMCSACAVVIFAVNMIWAFPYCYMCLIAYIVPATIAVVYAKIIGRKTK